MEPFQSAKKNIFSIQEDMLEQLALLRAIDNDDRTSIERLSRSNQIDPSLPIDFTPRHKLLSPLELATIANSLYAVKSLIPHVKTDLFRPYQGNLTVVHQAIMSDKMDILQEFIVHLDCKISSLPTALCPLINFACIQKKPDAIRLLLLSPHINVNQQDAEGNTALHYICKYDYSEFLDYLSARKELNFDIRNTNDQSPLECAILFRNGEVVQQLLKLPKVHWGIGEARKLIHWAIENDNLAIVKETLSRHPDIINTYNIYLTTPLCAAIYFQRREIIRYLVRQPELDPNLPIRYNIRPIHCAIERQDIYACKCIISADRIDPHIPNVFIIGSQMNVWEYQFKINFYDLEWCGPLQEYLVDPSGTQQKYLKEIYMDDAARTFALMVGFSDAYLKKRELPLQGLKKINAHRYLTIAQALPQEIQHRLALLTHGIQKNFIPVEEVEPAVRWLFKNEID